MREAELPPIARAREIIGAPIAVEIRREGNVREGVRGRQCGPARQLVRQQRRRLLPRESRGCETGSAVRGAFLDALQQAMPLRGVCRRRVRERVLLDSDIVGEGRDGLEVFVEARNLSAAVEELRIVASFAILIGELRLRKRQGTGCGVARVVDARRTELAIVVPLLIDDAQVVAAAILDAIERPRARRFRLAAVRSHAKDRILIGIPRVGRPLRGLHPVVEDLPALGPDLELRRAGPHCGGRGVCGLDAAVGLVFCTVLDRCISTGAWRVSRNGHEPLSIET